MYVFFVVLEHLKTFAQTLKKKTILQANKSKNYTVLSNLEIKLTEFVHFKLNDYVDNPYFSN